MFLWQLDLGFRLDSLTVFDSVGLLSHQPEIQHNKEGLL